MIKKPAQMDFSDKKFTIIISGQPGLGKTTLALSAPKPFLFDTDNGIARVNAAYRYTASIVDSYEEMLGDMLSDEFKEAESVVIDTGGTLVQLMKDWAKKQDAKAAKDGRAMYGVIKTEFDRLCYEIRAKHRKHLVIVFHTTEQQKGDTIQTRLACEGSTKDIVWTPADFGGHMFMMGTKRMIGFTPTDEYFAKGCFGIRGVMEVPELKDGQANDYLTRLFKKAQENISAEMSVFSGEKEKYEAAMLEGIALIQTATTPEAAQTVTDKLAAIDHALTSKAELKAALAKELKKNGIKWNTKEKCYVVLDDTKPAE